MQIQATSKYIRLSQRKMMLLADMVRKMEAGDAATLLAHVQKNGAVQLRALILSAIANGKVKNIDATTWKFKNVNVLAGPAMKRFRAVSRGMAHSYKKRMTHVTIVLTDITDGSENKKSVKKVVTKPKAVKS